MKDLQSNSSQQMSSMVIHMVSSNRRQSCPSRKHPHVCGTNSPNGYFFHPQGSNPRPCLREINHVQLEPTSVCI
ncbi:unnamed protein product [Lupinus luteus]|uniref:Uncharacterized protein n=1 Tax=Lupinus luteus TaxID=3873 RepID=A0AAV1VU09_LUPLU